MMTQSSQDDDNLDDALHDNIAKKVKEFQLEGIIIIFIIVSDLKSGSRPFHPTDTEF